MATGTSWRAAQRPGRPREPWADPHSIRAEMYSDEQLLRHAVSLADVQVVLRQSRPKRSLLHRVEQNRRSLVDSYRAIMRRSQAGQAVTPAAEWLADNFHSVETTIRQINRDLPAGYVKQLPKLGPGFLQGHPRILGLVWGYVAHTDSNVDPERLGAYIRAHETRKAMTVGELWAVPICLRIVLIENLRRLAEQIVASAQQRGQADVVADLLLGMDGSPPVPFDVALPPHARPRLGRPFTIQLARRLSEQSSATASEWVRSQLLAYGLDPEDAVQLEHQTQAQSAMTMHNVFRSLRTLTDVNWEDWVESVSLVEAELRSNPGYAEADFETRNLCRSAIERLARGSGQEEIVVARAVLARAATSPDEVGHEVGFWLLDDGELDFRTSLGYRAPAGERLARAIRGSGLAGYLGLTAVVALLVMALTLWPTLVLAVGTPVGWVVLLWILAASPAADLAFEVVNRRVARSLPASFLSGLALRDGVPEQYRTLVVIPSLLVSAPRIGALLQTLEVHFHANDDGEVYFAAATDWADSPIEHGPDDDVLLDAARAGIAALNATHGDRFLLFHRSRRFNPVDGVWMGWERKRGKLEELNLLLRGSQHTSYSTIEGRIPGRFQYILTLDSDTVLPRGAAKRLVSKLAHPLNRARFAPDSRQVVRGYSILQPRVTPPLPSPEDSSSFQAVYSTLPGLGPYAFTVSDVYQDLFGEGSFTGKGIYDVDAVTTALADRIEENSVLSHDLLEGNLARAGLVSDVEVVETYPTSYAVAASRSHRWARGDWQLLPWILRRHEGLSRLGRWKMLDNLRRSLSPVLLVASLLVASAALPTAAAAYWTVLVVASLLVPPVVRALTQAVRPSRGITARSRVEALVSDLRADLNRGILNFVLLSHQAALMVDAIVRSLWRMHVTHRNLLEWTTAASAQHDAAAAGVRYARTMVGGFAAPAALIAIGLLRGPATLALVVVPALVWCSAPLVAERVSRPRERRALAVTPDEVTYLRVTARATWRFFETFVSSEDHHLPPDNFQEDPTPVVAHRTSPTNIGLYLLATISAYDFGWIGRSEAVERLDATLLTVGRLEHHRGHLLNWYDTRTAEPLLPRYVSSVDSGNLAGHLLVVASTCREWIGAPDLVGPSGDGIGDGLAMIRQTADAFGLCEGGPHHRTGVTTGLAAAEAAVAALGGEVDPVKGLAAVGRALDTLAVAVADQPELLARVEETRRSVTSHERDAELTPAGREARDGRLAVIERRARDGFAAMDFSFLLDPHRGLLSIGYRVHEAELDESCYDLLASECRLASYLAIAKGDVPTRHWARLGRPITAAGGGAALVSWSGSMFEYLMPELVMRGPATSLLSSTARRVVRRQIAYGAQRGLPWGVSESGFFARDLDHNYQYSPFGVPGVGAVRRLGDDLVVAPYATGLASMIRPAAAVQNYRRLAALGASGSYGFYEAVDFTRARLPETQEFGIVRSYMAHHQGMTIVAIGNVVHDARMPERFHREPIVRATELLLEERAPREVPITHALSEESQGDAVARAVVPAAERTLVGAFTTSPVLHLMSNGRLSLAVTAAGGGQLSWNDLAITRWHPDLTTGVTGQYIYLRDDRTGHLWSATAEPVPAAPDEYIVRFAEDRARYVRRDGDLSTTLECHLSPESDAMVQRITIRNDGGLSRRLTVTSYAEPVLAEPRGDAAHPAFSKMFVHTEFLAAQGVLLATRRRRSSADPEVWAAHFLVCDPVPGHGAPVGDPIPECDRLAFIGRNRSPRSPRWFDDGVQPAKTTGDVLDPILSLSQAIDIPPDADIDLAYWTVVAATREQVLNLVDQHRADGSYERVTMLAWTQGQIQLRHLGITPDQAAQFQTLAGDIAFPQHSMRGRLSPSALAGPQSALWPLGISGDLPVVVVRIDDAADLDVVRQLVTASRFWRLKRFAVDVVLVNEQPTSYLQELQHDLLALASAAGVHTDAAEAHGRVVVVRRDQAAPATIDALIGGAAVVLVARRGELAKQIAAPRAVGPQPPIRPRPLSRPAPGADARERGALFNGLGEFSRDGTEYVTVLDDGVSTPAPWTNVVANEQFGFHATAEGAGYTWWRNSRDNQITPWRNDPVCAPVSEALYVRDDETGQVSSPTASPIAGGRHVAHHGFGYTRYTHMADGLDLDETVFVAPDDPVKLSLLVIRNRSDRKRILRVTAYAELVLGLGPDQTSRHLTTEYDPLTRALLARNPWSAQFPDQVVFLDLRGRQTSWTGDRGEFLGRNGTPASPAGILAGRALSGTVGPGLDPCAAMQQRIEVEAGAEAEVLVLLGAGHDVDEVRALVSRYRERDPHALLESVRRSWHERLSVVRVTTPSPAFDVMMNGWLLYQTLACRMLARSGYYQASGAFGFRDQLQDSMAVVLTDPAAARQHILQAAGRQFPEGDVQHWWLPATGQGVRTRISDDVVWLAHVVGHYLTVTGDAGILEEEVPFLSGDVLALGETERFFQPDRSPRSATLYEHCVLGLERALARGRHGLPLIGSGDWNDGMNRVGAEGRGESVWLGWFLAGTLGRFAEVALARGDAAFAERCSAERASLATAIEAHGWDGAWYRRGYFDDGTPLGSATRAEDRIDGIAQSWAVLSGVADPDRAAMAMEQADEQLLMPDAGLIRLFTPPFTGSTPDPGYVSAYPPGVRENGGQYTHGALWSVFAWARLGREDRAGAVLDLLNPVNHALTPGAVRRYRVEPYVVAADVYTEEPYVGRGGWTWYTGSAGWMFRAGLEAVLGLYREGDELRVEPCLPPAWDGVTIRYRLASTTYEITIDAACPTPRRVARMVVDGAPREGSRLPLIDDGGVHAVTVVMETLEAWPGDV
ncbi:MAG: protein ndvB [Propionibacterium sp.]|nr:protein ndvB [Propionibacterium sp.]